MFRIATFGGLSLTDDSGSSVDVSRRRLAILALLASAGDLGMRRDKLIAHLWPESSADDARHSLEQLLYSLRRQLGPNVFLGTDPLRLNHDVVASDRSAFDSAIERDADVEAIFTYRGPFLDGFYLKDADDFERWVEEERSRLSTAYGAALQRIADSASQRSDWMGAVTAWRGLVALDPLSARNAFGLVRSLADAGDRAEALRAAATHESLIKRELDIPLEPSLAAFVQSLRSARDGAVRIPEARVIEQAASQADPPSNLAAIEVLSANGDIANRAAQLRPARHPLVTRTVLLLALSVAIAAVWLGSHLLARRHVIAGADRQRVAVTVFENRTGDPGLDLFGIMAADYTRIALAGTGLIDVVGPAFDIWQSENARPESAQSVSVLVKQTGATIVVMGAYYKEGDSLLFTAHGIDAKSGRFIFGFDSVKASVHERREAVEQVRQHVMSAIASHVDPALRAWAGSAGKPPMRFDAYQEFADGMAGFVRGIAEQGTPSRGAIGFASAREHLERAFRLDSTYYVAALWWFWSRNNVGDRAGADSVLAVLAPRRTLMSPYERALYDYNVAVNHGTPDDRFQLDEKLVAFASASEFLFCRARDALESLHPREALDVLETINESYSWVKLMRPPLGLRVRALVQQGEHARALEVARQIHQDAPDDLSSNYPEIDALSALGRLDDIEQVIAKSSRRGGSAEEASPNLMLYAGLRLQSAGRNAQARSLFERALAVSVPQSPIRGSTDDVLLMRGRSLYYLQYWDEARVAFDQLARLGRGASPHDRRALLFLGSLAARRGDVREVSRLRKLFHESIVIPAAEEYFDARVAALRGDRNKALELLAAAVSHGAQADEFIMDGDAAPSMDPDFASLRASPAFRTAVGRW